MCSNSNARPFLVAEGIRQNLDNQKKVFIEHFFATMQFVMAGNDTEGLRYGTISQSSEKYYLTWKEEGSGIYSTRPFFKGPALRLASWS